MNQRYELIARIKSNLEEAGTGKVMPVDDRVLLDILPHFWREDAETPEEWFIKLCRAFGLHATHDPLSHRFRVRITIDAEDEARIWEMKGTMRQVDIAAQFGVSWQVISGIYCRRHYKQHAPPNS